MKTNGLNYEKHYCNKSTPQNTVVFLHGLTGNTKRWNPYVAELKNDFDLITIDLIGHGSSDFPNNLEDYSFASQSKRIKRLLRKEGVKRSAIVCHSYSYKVALELIKKETIFTQLIMISPFTLNSKKTRKVLLNFIMFFWKFFTHKRKQGRFKYPQTSAKPSFFDYKTAIEEIGLKSYLAHLYYCLNFLENTKKEKVKTPSLVIYKENDRLFTKEMMEKLKQSSSNLLKKKVPGNGHLFLNEDRKDILQAMTAFLRN